ncbi:MAG: hypothetical protein Q9179_002260 [Wetmoreana sp. 5 TL-2023]
MAVLTAGFPTLNPETVSLYYTKDPVLENLPILVFYGSSTTRNATRSSARIQAHIYSLAGFKSFPNLTVAPTSPLYAAVKHLPSDKQGDEIFRGLAVSLLSYFAGLTGPMKDVLRELAGRRRPDRVAPAMFDEMHAGDLASNMVELDDAGAATRRLSTALAQQSLTWIDVDVLLPPQTIERVVAQEGSDLVPAFGEDGLPLFHYGQYESLMDQFGHPAFLPTSKLRRAPSRPTAHSKLRSLSKEQKVALRREMCEVLDTEKSYVAKLQCLVDEVAVQLRQSIHADIQRTGLRVGESPIRQLFPESLSRIAVINAEFLTELEDVLSATEDEAIQDIEGLAEALAKLQLEQVNMASRKRDPTGTLAFAKTLLKWMPRFSGPYQEYMRTSADIPKALNAARDDGTSKLAQALNEFGEQRLRSMLIEPVQRLPRYSLLLDNMIGQLPASHPALSNLLKLKDVIADICALDNGSPADSTRTSSALRRFIRDWPSWLSPRGRLIAAVDAIELAPPYDDTSSGLEILLLLFPDTVIIARRESGNALTAKGILVEIERPAMTPSLYQTSDKGLLYSTAFELSKLRLSESADGRVTRMIYTGTATSSNQASLEISNTVDTQVKVVSLLGPYECKAQRLSEDIAKARIEGRFPEPIRESDKWALRTVDSSQERLGLIAAIYEEGDNSRSRLVPAHCCVQVSNSDHNDLRGILVGDKGIEIAVHISPLKSNVFKLHIEGVGGSRFSGTSAIENVGQLLVDQVTRILRSQAQSGTRLSAFSEVSINREVLRAQSVRRVDEEPNSRSSRPISPIKLVSNLFGGSINQPDTPSRWKNQTLRMKEIPPIPPPKPVSHVIEDQSKRSPEDHLTLIAASGKNIPDPLTGLELTFNAYVIALRSRSGNVVGRILRNRATADELEVNELYNTLIEDPSRVQVAAEVSIDVLFAAFEKFLTKAWQERMGTLLTPDVLMMMTSGFDSGRPTEFSQQVKRCLEEISPQNRRALSASIKLLSDLLESSGSDGDRGALMASFTEVLVAGSNPHDYITLFDRLVDDYDDLFDANGVTSTEASPGTSSVSNSLHRNRSINTGSLSSNASSLKKRFGFGNISRENSKSESDSKVASVWRTLSKNARSPGDAQKKPASLSKGSLIRSRSTDTDPRILPPLRPSSRDIPTPPDASPRSGANSRPTSSHINMSVLSTIGENTPTKAPGLLKKKRRSSLSDLKPVQDSSATTPWLPLQPRRLPQSSGSRGTPPRPPSDRTQGSRFIPSVDYSHRLGSPERFGSLRQKSPQRFGSPPQKENSPSQTGSPKKTGSPSIQCYQYKKPPAPTEVSEVTIKSLSPKKRIPSSTGVSTARGGLTERAWPPNNAANISPTKTSQPSPQKLRMQSPQKLRERLSNEQKALSGAESSLQAEIAKIGEEMSVFNLSRPWSTRPSPDPSHISSPAISSLQTQLDSLSASLNALTTDLQSRHANLSKDVESSLLISERKARKLDDLYKEANAENEALYDRFNDELGKVLKAVKGGEGAEELKRKIREREQEGMRLRKENARLKREVVGLRSQLSEL